jgi:hypothetical protein
MLHTATDKIAFVFDIISTFAMTPIIWQTG